MAPNGRPHGRRLRPGQPVTGRRNPTAG